MPKSLSKLLMVGALLTPVSALAIPITVDFTIQGTSAYDSTWGHTAPSYNGFDWATSTGTGWFTIDDSVGDISTIGTGVTPLDFSLDWAGISFTEAEALLYIVQFDGTGGLNYWQFGAFGPGDCGLNCLSSGGPKDFWVTGNEFDGEGGVAAIHEVNVDGWMMGEVTWNVRATPVPEPATLGLMSLGLLGMFATRRRKDGAGACNPA